MVSIFVKSKWVLAAVAAFSIAFAQDQQDSIAALTNSMSNPSTSWEVTNSTYLNVSATSNVPLQMKIESVPEIITISIQASEDPSAEITLGGLEISTDYYKYVDGMGSEEKVTTDATGTITFTIDLDKAHVIFIRPSPSTVHVPPLFGTTDNRWNPVSRIFTLDANVTDGISIDSSNVTLEGNGKTVSMAGGNGITVGGPAGPIGVKIRNLSVTGSTYGIYLVSTTWDSILNCKVFGNFDGIRMASSQYNAVVRCSLKTNTNYGICLNNSSNNTVKGNVIEGNSVFGLEIEFNCYNNTVCFNRILNNAILGMQLYGASPVNNNAIYGNLFSGNAFSNAFGPFGVQMNWSCTGNTITDNNFVGDLVSSRYNPGTQYNGNYWSTCANPNLPYTFVGWIATITDAVPLAHPVGPNVLAINAGAYQAGNAITIPADLQVFHPLNNVASALYSLDNGPWTAMTAYDGAFNSSVETALAPLGNSVPQGPHALCVRGFDDQGYFGLDLCANFTVTPANQPPTANAGADQVVSAGAQCNASVTLSGSGSDPENGVLTYVWTGPFGNASGATATITLGIGVHNVVLTVTDPQGLSGQDNLTVTVVDVTPPTPSVTSLPTFTGDDAVTPPVPTALDNCAGTVTGMTTTVFPITTRGSHSVLWTYDDGNGNISSQTQTVVVFYTTALSASAGAAQYSDTAVLSATLTSHGSGLPGKTIAWTVNGNPVGTTLTNGAGQTALKWKITLPAGTYPVVAAFAEDAANYYRGSTASASLSASAENATVSYTGAPIVPYPNALTLSAHVTQEADGSLGDLANAKVLFEVKRTNADGSITEIGSYTVPCNAAGDAVSSISQPVGVYNITMTVVCGYFTSAPEFVIVPVYDPKGGLATGGGFIVVTNPMEGDLGRANFGFNARYEKGGSSTGNLEFQYKDGDLDLKSVSIDWLVISATNAQFQGTAGIQGRTGLFTFRVNCTDNLNNGNPDKFAISVWQGIGTGGDPIYKAQNQTLAGGNILVKNK